MKKLGFLTLFFLSIFSMEALSQDNKELSVKDKILAEGQRKNIFDKKFRWGISYNSYWSTINGSSLPEKYFVKPSVGFNLRTEYYPLSFVGIGAGFGLQQRGAGIWHQDNYGGSFSHPWIKPTGDLDSTHINKLRFNTLELPVTLLLRTPKDIIKGIRLSAAAGVVFIHDMKANNTWIDVAGGNHISNYVTQDYLRNDLGYQVSFGTDINAGESNLIQVHLVYTKGTKNIYAANQGDGRQQTFGVRVAFLF